MSTFTFKTAVFFVSSISFMDSYPRFTEIPLFCLAVLLLLLDLSVLTVNCTTFLSVCNVIYLKAPGAVGLKAASAASVVMWIRWQCDDVEEGVKELVKSRQMEVVHNEG